MTTFSGRSPGAHWFIALSLAASFLVPAQAVAQEGDGAPGPGWFPSGFVVQPVSRPRSGVEIGLGIFMARRDTPAGSGEVEPEGDVAFGYRVPIYRFAAGEVEGEESFGLDLGLEAGVLARFALGGGDNGLVNTDFRVAFPVGADFGRWETRLSLVHESSHLGDDFLERRPGVSPRASSRNGVEGEVLYRASSRIRLFGALDYNWATANLESVAGRLGVAFDPPSRRGGGARPIGVLVIEASDFGPGFGASTIVGIALATALSDVRLGLVAHAGQSGMGQFRSVREEYVGLFLALVPPVVRRSGGAGE